MWDKIPPQEFALKMQGGLMREGGAYLRDTTIYAVPITEAKVAKAATFLNGRKV